MKSFPFLFIALFIIVYISATIISYIVLDKIFRGIGKKYKIPARIVYCGYSALILTTFIFLYFYPYNARESTNYPFYFLFNVFLVVDIYVKIIITLFSIPYFILRLFKKNITSLLYAGLIISIGIIGSALIGATFGKNQIRINRVEFEFSTLPYSFDGFIIVQISDIHIGSFNKNQKVLKRIINKIRPLDPNLLLFTGDLVNNFKNETIGWQPLFSGLQAEFGKYAILGNHDYGDYFNWKSKTIKEENFNSIITDYKDLGFQLLRNESAIISNIKDTIYLVGVENWGHPPFPQHADLNSALEDVPENSFKILMTHDPAHWESKINGIEDIPLTLSGHTHGLQWGIKPAGIEFSLMYLMRKSWAGLYGREGQYLYVNRGLGTIGINFRLDMPAEITLITLRKK
jgi:uncharacterized protein